MKSNHLYSFLALALAPTLASASSQVTSAAGAAPAEIQAAVDAFRSKLGANNAAAAGPFAGGFRNINWDGVPDTAARPGTMAGNFFAARGVVFSTPGTALTNSAKAVNPTNTAVRFGDIDPSYSTSFQAFSAERLFTPIGSTIVDATFSVPSSVATAASTNAFGVVFTDVDLAGSATIEFFNADNVSLGKFEAPVANGGLSFIGVLFDAGERATRVRVTHGTQAIAAGVVDNAGAGVDVVVADDYMYGEPLPLPSSAGLVIAASSRAQVGTGENVLISGFVIDGTQPRLVLARGVGPSLAGFGITGFLANPTLTVFNSAGQSVATNDDWANNTAVAQAAAKAGGFPLTANSADAAVLAVLNPGAYTVVVSGVGNTTGVTLAEVYDIKLK